MRPLVATAVHIALAGSAVAASPAPAPPTFEASSDIVNLWVNVGDAAGRPAKGLVREDFVVLDQGVRRPVERFASQSAPGPDSWLDLDVALLLDTSASMLKDINQARASALAFLPRIPHAKTVFVGAFDTDTKLARYAPDESAAVQNSVTIRRPGGSTVLYDSLDRALRAMGPGGGRPVLILLTDGVDVGSSVGLDQVNERLLRAGATVYAVQFHRRLDKPGLELESTVASAALTQLTTTTGGLLLDGDRADPAKLFDRILADIASQYVVGFTPEPDVSFHTMKVSVRRPGFKTRHRAGYYPPGPR